MRKELYTWLEKEVPEWVKEGMLSVEHAGVLLERYKGTTSEHRSWSMMAFSLIGFALVGFGVISLLAYNWDMLGNIERTLLAVGLLLGAQGFSVWVKAYRFEDKALLEGSALLWFLLLGASLAIIGQTYHLGGTLIDFTYGWLLLGFAIFWLLSSRGVAFLSILLWSGIWLYQRSAFHSLRAFAQEETLTFAVLLFIGFVWFLFYRWQMKVSPHATALLSWALALTLLCVGGIELVSTFEYRYEHTFFMLILSLMLSIFYLIGRLVFFDVKSVWHQPFEILGKWGVIFILIAHLPLRASAWYAIETLYVKEMLYSHLFLFFSVLYGGLLLFCILKKRLLISDLLVVLAPMVFSMFALFQHDPYGKANFLATCFINGVFVLGVMWMMYMGAKRVGIVAVNEGMVLLAILIWIHFMDANMPLTTKGIAFIVTGVLFLGINTVLRKRLRKCA